MNSCDQVPLERLEGVHEATPRGSLSVQENCLSESVWVRFVRVSSLYARNCSNCMEESSLDELQIIQRDHCVELERLRVLSFQEHIDAAGSEAHNDRDLALAWSTGFIAGMRLGELAGKTHAYRSWLLAATAGGEHPTGVAWAETASDALEPGLKVESAEQVEQRVTEWTAFCQHWQREWQHQASGVYGSKETPELVHQSHSGD